MVKSDKDHKKWLEGPDFAATSLFDAATRYETLMTAWQKVYKNGGGAGGDGMPREVFAKQAENRVSGLSHNLRNGRYKPAPFRSVALAKKSGGHRVLHIPSIIDRVAQGAVALTLTPLLEAEMEDASFAYRPGRSVAQAIQKVSSYRRDGFKWVVDGDIEQFFDSVPHDQMLDLLERVIGEERLVDLIALWLEAFNSEGLGLPQGSPLSPLLANLYLDKVDEEIEGRGVRLVRFADDFVLLCKDEAKAKGALEKMRALLAQYGLFLNEEKTRLVPFDKGFRFLGHVFVRSMVWREVWRDETPSDNAIEAAEAAILKLQAEEEALEEERKLNALGEEGPRGRWAVRQRVLYMVEKGRTLTTKGQHFIVQEGEEEILRLPHSQLDRIEIHQGVFIDMAAFDLAAACEVEIVRVDGRGQSLGHWSGASPFKSKLHLAQAATILDEERRVLLAKTIAETRVFNQRALVRRLNRTRSLTELDEAAVKLGRTYRKFRKKGLTVQQIMGIEGEGASYYWPALGQCVDKVWRFGGKRARRGQYDPINSMFDIFANMLMRDLEVAIERVGLHKGFSLLHSVDDGDRPSLVYDLAEEFRSPVAEAAVLTNIGRGGLTPDLFTKAEVGWRPVRGAWPTFIRVYETWINRAILDPIEGDKVYWRTLYERQAERLATSFLTGDDYQTYRMDY